MAAIRVKLNSRGMGAMLNSAEVRRELTNRASRVLAAAQAAAPVDTGAYRASLHLQQATTDRAVVRVVAGTDHAFVVEADRGTLARALGAAG